MNEKWNFSKSTDKVLNGISEAGIETYNGTPYSSLAREVCQNSLDAGIDPNKPVIVEFESGEIIPERIPGLKTLQDSFDSGSKFWEKYNGKKEKDFFDKALEISEEEKIQVLRVSDFNTTGLTGSDQNYNTPWSNLVRSSGVSQKQGTSGGSFGIGKSACFACSDLRTVFYSTVDQKGLQAFQGVCRLPSFPLSANRGFNRNAMSYGQGFYESTNRKDAVIRESRSLMDSYNRSQVGTDIFVLGFPKTKDWKDTIVVSVLNDFLVSIFQGRLIVKVEDVVISKDTLGELVEKHQNKAKLARDYYQVLTSDEAVTQKLEISDLGYVKLKLLLGEGLGRRVFMSRGNGMKVFDQSRFPRNIQFSGVCILEDDKVNAYFRRMENPKHDGWEPKRLSQGSTLGEKRRKELFRLIKSSLLDLAKKTTVAEIDARGVGEFLPDETGSGETAVAEAEGTGEAETKKGGVRLTISPRKGLNKGFKPKAKKTLTGYRKGKGLREGPMVSGLGPRKTGTGKKSGSSQKGIGGLGKTLTGGANGIGGPGVYLTGKADDGDENLRVETLINPVSVRLMLMDPDQKKYRLVFIPELSSKEAQLEFKVVGENENFDLTPTISDAFDMASSSELKTWGNRIGLENVKANKKMAVEFTADCDIASSMEVQLVNQLSNS